MISERILTPVLHFLASQYLKLDRNQDIRFPPPQKDQQYVLYIHIPFCEMLCPYCSFNRFLYKEKIALTYFQNLRKEMEFIADLGYNFTSIYIGGGTPTVNINELTTTIDLAKQLFDIKEVSCETNPNHLTPEIIEQLSPRVDRLSVGIQSFDNDLLKQMGRLKVFGTGDEQLQDIKNAVDAFPTLNIDMIFNFPSQTAESLKRDVEYIIQSRASQVSFYPLMTSSSVASTMDKTIGQVTYKNEAAYYDILSRELSKAYTPSSAWTFSLKSGGMIDEYIVDNEEYIGIGSGSFSYLNGALYVNTFSLKQYNELVSSGKLSVTAMKKFNKQAQMRYRFLMELFGLKLDKKRFREHFGIPIELGLWLETAFMKLSNGFSKNRKDALTLTAKGRYLLVVMMREFFIGVNNVRDQARSNLTSEEKALFITGQHGNQSLNTSSKKTS